MRHSLGRAGGQLQPRACRTQVHSHLLHACDHPSDPAMLLPGYVSECCRISTAPRTPLPFALARATHWVGRVGNYNLRHVACRSTLSVAGGRRLVQLELAGERCVDGADVDGFERMCERLKELQRLCDSLTRSAQGRGPEGRRSKTDLVACCESLERCPLIHCSAHKRLSSAFVSM